MTLEQILEYIQEYGWKFIIRTENNEYKMSIIRPEWPTGLYNSIAVPTFTGKTVLDAANKAYQYIIEYWNK